MPLSFPPHPNPVFLRKQAKLFLKRFRKQDRTVLSLLRHKKKYRDFPDIDLLQAEVTLQEIQHCLSCEYGFTSWLEMNDFVQMDSAVREKCFRELHHFLDPEGKFKAWPAKRKKQLVLIEYLSVKFRPHRFYTEQEVNELLLKFHSFADPALLRRALVSYGYLDRERDCSKYWKK